MAVLESGAAGQGLRIVDLEPRAAIVCISLWLGATALYLATACPTVFWYDSAEYTAAAWTLGVPHPPGYPVYVWLGYLFTQLTDDPAYGLNIMSGLFGGLAVGATYGLAREFSLRTLGATTAALAVALNPVFWRNAVIAEVYTPALFVLACVWWLAIRGVREHRPRWLVTAAAVAGVGLGLHLFVATTGLGLAYLVFSFPREATSTVSARRGPSQAQLVVVCLLAAFVGASVLAWVPIRAAMEPAVNFQTPAQGNAWWWMLSGGQYKHWFVAPLSGARVWGIVRIFADFVSWPGLLAGVVGLGVLARRRRALGMSLILGIAGNVWFFSDYKVHDVENFFLPAGLLLACGVGAAVDELARCGFSRRVTPRLVAIIAFVVFWTLRLFSGFGRNDLAEYREAQHWGEQACRELPTDAIVINYTTFTEWKFDAVLRSYYRVVRSRRPDLRFWLVPDAQEVAAAVTQGLPVFAYQPVPMLTSKFDLQPHGGLYRVFVRPARPTDP
ncbi:MAG: DUF2723 domain-containing protein [Myxococcales bacterium FL481]|nr:MAG: DUF2723 domain-containing protein [Myxococcales bacterium FL481]